MFKKRFLLLPIFAMSLSACAGVHHEIKDYILELNYKDNYRILQLSDTHIGDKDNTKLHYDFLDLTIKEANPDLIVITGDVFTFASRGTAKEFFDFLDSYEVPWTLVFGNHDEQCCFSIDWVTKEIEKHEYAIFKDLRDDDIQGNSNFAINLKVGPAIFEQLIFMDSNRYYYGDYFGYDWFKQDQINWYKDLVDYTKEQNGGLTVPSLMFYHIPLPEVNDAWAYAEKNPSAVIYTEGVMGEAPCNPDPGHDLHFFDVIKEKHSTHGMYFGHDHVNNFIVNYEGIDFGYGIKATDRVYYDEALLGGRVIVLKTDHSLAYENFYHSYAEVK